MRDVAGRGDEFLREAGAHVFGSDFLSAVAAEYNGFHFAAPVASDGFWLLGFWLNQSFKLWSGAIGDGNDKSGELTQDDAILMSLNGVASKLNFYSGTTIASGNSGTGALSSNLWCYVGGLYVPAGRYLAIGNAVANESMTLSFELREPPS